MPILNWFDARDAEALGIELADRFAAVAMAESQKAGGVAAKSPHSEVLRAILEKADGEFQRLDLNLYRKAKFANSFKWRLLEKGIPRVTADEMTQSLLMQVSESRTAISTTELDKKTAAGDAKQLFAQGNKALKAQKYSEAAAHFQDLVNFNPRSAVGFNNLGSALSRLGRYNEAEEQFRRAISIEPLYPDPHANLGTLLRWRGQVSEAEKSLRQALKLKPTFVEARTSLGLTLILLGKLRDARARFDKVLKASKNNTEALLGMAQLSRMEGRFDDAKTYLSRALQTNPNLPSALAAFAGLKKMSVEDIEWRKDVERVAASGISPLEEADLQFAIGKFYDDTDDFDHAFQSFKRGNQLLKSVALDYDRAARTRFVDGLSKVYTAEAISQAKHGASQSEKPVFVVGMMRSGTSLVEQIIASHPSASGGGELEFWNEAVLVNDAAMRNGPPAEPLRSQLANAYLRDLSQHSATALRIVDKTPANSDYLGIIHSVFPKARIIYMQRDPIDTCLSCYFQQFLPSLNFSLDLADLAHYYREHHRLMAHWRSVLPPGSILDVPYEELVADQERWTRRILEFLGLDWDARVMEFYRTERPVLTASSWQVRQKIYGGSVQRWKKYERFIKPLVGLRELSSP